MWIICTVYIEIQQNQCRTTILFVLTKGVVIYGIIKTDEPRTLDFSGVRGFLVTNMFIVQCSVTYNVHSLEPYRISSTAAFSSSKVL